MALARLACAIKKRFGLTIIVPQLAKLPSLLHLQLFLFSGGTISVTELLNHQGIDTTDTKRTPTETEQGTRWWREVERVWEPLESFLVDRTEVSGRIGKPRNEENQNDGHTHHNEHTKEQQKYCGNSPGGDILLTGATGFFGAFLLHAILNQPFYSKRRIVCVVRAKDNNQAWLRVLNNLAYYGKETVHFHHRVTALAGDISQPQFGLEAEEYASLVCSVRVIFHNAAVVNSALPYASLRTHNVIATSHILRFAAESGAFSLHHISTIGLLAGSGVQDETANVPPTALSLLSGYAQSKWVAEQLVIRARERLGVPCRIYRPGTLSGDSQTGACNPHDAVTRLLLGLSREGVYCSDEDSPLPRTFHLIPTDWAASALVNISTVLPFNK